MKVIWKFPVTDSSVDIAIPQGARILCLQMQAGQPCIWAEVDIEAPAITRTAHIVMTGQGYASCPGEYCGTVQDGAYVLHIFLEA